MTISFKWIEATSKHAHLSNDKDIDVDFGNKELNNWKGIVIKKDPLFNTACFLLRCLFLLERSKQSAALGLPMPGASWPTSLQKFQASKATLKPSLLIPGSPTAVSPAAPETPSTTTFTKKNTTRKWVSMAIPRWVLSALETELTYLYTSIRWGLSQQAMVVISYMILVRKKWLEITKFMLSQNHSSHSCGQRKKHNSCLIISKAMETESSYSKILLLTPITFSAVIE